MVYNSMYARECAGNSISLSASPPTAVAAGRVKLIVLTQLHLGFVFEQFCHREGLVFTLPSPVTYYFFFVSFSKCVASSFSWNSWNLDIDTT